jgi:hypothetical protein
LRQPRCPATGGRSRGVSAASIFPKLDQLASLPLRPQRNGCLGTSPIPQRPDEPGPLRSARLTRGRSCPTSTRLASACAHRPDGGRPGPARVPDACAPLPDGPAGRYSPGAGTDGRRGRGDAGSGPRKVLAPPREDADGPNREVGGSRRGGDVVVLGCRLVCHRRGDTGGRRDDI